VSPDLFNPGYCSETVAGTGLQPGSDVSDVLTESNGFIEPLNLMGSAALDGTFSYLQPIYSGQSDYVVGTAAGGTPITSNTVTC
jgi:hypothetical protein